jgi:hypothetical protein
MQILMEEAEGGWNVSLKRGREEKRNKGKEGMLTVLVCKLVPCFLLTQKLLRSFVWLNPACLERLMLLSPHLGSHD